MLGELLAGLFEQDPASAGSSGDGALDQAVHALKAAKQAADETTRKSTIKQIRSMHGGKFETLANNEIDYRFKKAAQAGKYFNQKDLQKVHDDFWDWVADHIETFDAGKGTFQNWLRYLSGLFASSYTKKRAVVEPGMGRPASTREIDPEKYAHGPERLPKMEPYTDDERVVASVIHNYLAAVAKGSEPFPYSMKNPTREKAAAFIDMFLSYWGIGTPRLSAPDIVQKYPELVPNRFNLRQLMQTMSLSMKKYVQRAVGRFGVSDPEAAYTQLFQKLSGRNFGSASKTEPSIHAEFDDRMDELLSALTGVFKVA